MSSGSQVPAVAEPAILPGASAPVTASEAAHPAAAAEGRHELPESHDADRAFHAALAHLTGGISPTALALAWLDWASHLASAPAKRLDVARDAVQRARRLASYAAAASSSKDQP